MSQNFRKLLFFVSFFLVVFGNNSCQVEDCPCSLLINGRWIGQAKDSTLEVFLMLNLSSSNSDFEGNGTLLLKIDSYAFENLVTCNGSYVGNKVVFKINEIDSLSYEGLLNTRRDTIVGNLYFRSMRLPFLLEKVQLK